MQGEEKKDGQLLDSQKEVRVMGIEPNEKEKSNEQVLREMKWKVWKIVKQMSEKPTFIEAGFNLTNSETFVKQAIELKEQLKEDGVIPISEECSAIIKQEIIVL